MDSKMVHDFKLSLSVTLLECNKAVSSNQGSKETFSTGSKTTTSQPSS